MIDTYKNDKLNAFVNPRTKQFVVDTKFFNPTQKNSRYTKLSTDEIQWILDFHKLKTFMPTADWVSGFFDAERYFHFKQARQSFRATVNIRQNHREFHLLIAVAKFFDEKGSLTIANPKTTHSTFEWRSSQEPNKLFNVILPQLKQLTL